MEAETSKCIREYIDHQYRGGVIGISTLAEYCHVSEGKLYTVLFVMQKHGEIEIIKRYFCPEGHPLPISNEKSFCEECDYLYPNEQIDIKVYIQPKTVKVPR